MSSTHKKTKHPSQHDHNHDTLENKAAQNNVADEVLSQESTGESTSDNNANFKQDDYDSKIAELETSLEVKEKEIEDWKNKAYRFSADLQNLHKQNQLDLQQARKKGKQTVIDLLLPFVNTMNLSFAFIPDSEDESLKKFVNTLKSSFDKLIADFGAAGIEFLVPEVGDDIDPEYMSVLNATGEEGDEAKVARIVGVGVRIDGQLVQEATVMV